MESSEGGRCGDLASDLMIILITAAQLVFFAFYHQFIAWPTRGADGSVAWLSVLTDDYSAWLPFPIAASIIVILASMVMIIWDNESFRQIAWIGFSLLGIAVTVSLVLIFPFDFSVIPNAKVAGLAPTVARIVLVLMATFYAVSAVFLSVKFVRRRDSQRAF